MYSSNSVTSLPISNSTEFAILKSFQIFSASGADTINFLHRQLTQDVVGIPNNTARLASYCNIKGQVLTTIVFWKAFLTDQSTGEPKIYGIMRSDIVQNFLDELSKFVLRDKVNLAISQLYVTGISTTNTEALQDNLDLSLPASPWQRTELPSGTWIVVPTTKDKMRWWWIANKKQFHRYSFYLDDLVKGAEESWHERDIIEGIPWIQKRTKNVFIPQSINLDLIGGLNFTKGCFPGQEIIARLHYRGTVKKRMVYGLVHHTNVGPDPILEGEDVYHLSYPNNPCGKVVNVATGQNGQLSLLLSVSVNLLSEYDLRLRKSSGIPLQVRLELQETSRQAEKRLPL